MLKSAKSSKIIVLIVFSFFVCGLGVYFFLRSDPTTNHVRNVILISIDTCRADHLSCYGYPLKTTPNIDALAQESLIFSNAYAPAPITRPSHSSMFTGNIPPYHGVHDNADHKLGETNVTLAELLGKNGFATGAVISAFVMDSQFGLDQGFDYYNDSIEKPLNGPNNPNNERRAEETTRFALKWLNSHKEENLFLFIHYFDPHQLYEPPEAFASKFHDNLYAGEIAYTDHCIGQVLEELKDLGLYESSLIIITSDHGEMLGEHGEYTHSYYIYESALKVPLIIKFPGNSKSKIADDPVGLIDIVPTICSVMGIETPPHVQGKDLSFYFSDTLPVTQSRHLYCESFYPTKYSANSLLGVVSDSWKYIQTSRPELYDLKNDPGEINNLVTKQPQQARILQDRLRQVLEESVRGEDLGNKAPLDEKTRSRLESLGYLSSMGVDENYEFDQGKEDPKDLIAFHRMSAESYEFIARKYYRKAKILCNKMIQERPQYLDAYYQLALIAREQGDFTGVVSSLARVVDLKPDEARAHRELGGTLLKLNRIDEAVKHLNEALRFNANHHDVYGNLGFALIQQRKYDQATINLKKALEIKPDFAEAHNDMGRIMALQGRFEEAATHFSEALETKPAFVEARTNLGNIYFAMGRIDNAVEQYLEAVSLRPDHAAAHYGLGNALASQGSMGKGIEHLTTAVRLNPNDLNALNNLAWILATNKIPEYRNGLKAVQLAEHAGKLTGHKHPLFLDTLAAAYAEAGRFENAKRTAQKGVELSRKAGRVKWEEGIKGRLKLYESNQAFYE